MLVDFLTSFGGLFDGDLALKLILFGANGAIVFQGLKINVKVQPTKKTCTISNGQIHFMAHQCITVV